MFTHRRDHSSQPPLWGDRTLAEMRWKWHSNKQPRPSQVGNLGQVANIERWVGVYATFRLKPTDMVKSRKGSKRRFPPSGGRYGWKRMPRGTPDGLALYGPSRMAAMAELYAGRPTQMSNRMRDGWRGAGMYTGRGGYLSDWWQKSRGALGTGFKAAARATGFGQAADMLDKAEAAGRSLGWGDYAVPAMNEIVNGGGADVVPSFKPAGDNSVCVSHREYISDVFGPAKNVQFQNTPYSLNPGLGRTFPWLSQIAQNYEEYTLRQLIFTFRSTVTDFVATNGQVGTIVMATQYNPTDEPFGSKQDAMEYDLSMSGKVSKDMLHGVECDPAQLSGAPGKYLRAGPVSHGQDLKQYDWGQLNIAISNIPDEFADQSLGELWVSYTIELRKPKFFVSRGLGIARDYFVADLKGDTLDKFVTESLQGQQNRIGGLLASVVGDPDKFTYVLPATFSGSISIKVKATTNAGSVAIGVSGWNADTVTRINDIFAGAWVGEYGTLSAPGGSQLTSESHWLVTSPPANGDNYVTFSATPGHIYTAVEVDVQLINTGFNYTPAGVVMVDNRVTGELEQFP